MAPASHEDRPVDPMDCPRVALEPTQSLTQLTIWAALGPIGSGIWTGLGLMKTFGCNGVPGAGCRVPGAGLDHQITVPHSIGGTLVLAPWTRRRTCEPDPAMTREAMKEVAWALLGTEAEHVF